MDHLQPTQSRNISRVPDASFYFFSKLFLVICCVQSCSLVVVEVCKFPGQTIMRGKNDKLLMSITYFIIISLLLLLLLLSLVSLPEGCYLSENCQKEKGKNYLATSMCCYVCGLVNCDGLYWCNFRLDLFCTKSCSIGLVGIWLLGWRLFLE